MTSSDELSASTASAPSAISDFSIAISSSISLLTYRHDIPIGFDRCMTRCRLDRHKADLTARGMHLAETQNKYEFAMLVSATDMTAEFP
ncbi:hypothetical protein [Bradyrhizobium sp. STM 3557]|uniref:hypothetical protein n=1 Tax=Bradyrhizobium sp. STM 3557 TaxID=578920 RepID=UPI00388F0262